MKAKGKDPAEIIRKRSAKVRRKRTGPVATTEPGKVARQGSGASTSAPANPAKSSDAADDGQPRVVKRQQPQKQARAKRKKNPTKE